MEVVYFDEGTNIASNLLMIDAARVKVFQNFEDISIFDEFGIAKSWLGNNETARSSFFLDEDKRFVTHYSPHHNDGEHPTALSIQFNLSIEQTSRRFIKNSLKLIAPKLTKNFHKVLSKNYHAENELLNLQDQILEKLSTDECRNNVLDDSSLLDLLSRNHTLRSELNTLKDASAELDVEVESVISKYKLFGDYMASFLGCCVERISRDSSICSFYSALFNYEWFEKRFGEILVDDSRFSKTDKVVVSLGIIESISKYLYHMMEPMILSKDLNMLKYQLVKTIFDVTDSETTLQEIYKKSEIMGFGKKFSVTEHVAVDTCNIKLIIQETEQTTSISEIRKDVQENYQTENFMNVSAVPFERFLQVLNSGRVSKSSKRCLFVTSCSLQQGWALVRARYQLASSQLIPAG